MVEDYLEFLSTLLDSSAHALGESQPGLVGIVSEGFDLGRAPLFVMGDSMGGALALHIGQRLNSAAGDASSLTAGRFRGAVLAAPAVQGNLPPAPVVWFIKHVVAPLLPQTCMPAFLETVNIPALIWAKEERRAQAAADQWGLPGGIGWGHPMRFGSAAALLQMSLDTQVSVYGRETESFMNDGAVRAAGALPLSSSLFLALSHSVSLSLCLSVALPYTLTRSTRRRCCPRSRSPSSSSTTLRTASSPLPARSGYRSPL